ncbi:hypothetical protein CLHUN_23950 [Ruminiclostridium hungatei]|uniref:Copper amine oxidase-like N-terminal domain-containing protein n=1 Tax=Ruminiclostridium hungatei TaxID=48256 RepID=A0A1V4SJQ4_RUMHU|nr:stalk domain-containing protein [Ruminiclostridium hungatei]OPX43675.1 hypothetical protein CLHUN_23950 [Ruminiclostridium hungatei]
MKKLLAVFSFVLCFVLLQAGVFAADTPIENKNSTELSVSFKAGTNSYTVNGKTVKDETSVTTGGKTFVPVKVITDALGAALTVDLKAKTAVISYNSVDIKLTDKKKEAQISGKKVSLDAAPYIKNNSFMASITSLADILGADVSTSGGKITFLKEIANPNSIKDFSSLIKKTTKAKIGDSYYNWSMQLPDDLKLNYRDFNGSENVFIANDESYAIAVYLFESDDGSNLDNAVNNIKESIKGYTLVDYKRDTNNGEDFIEFVYKDDIWTTQFRVYITDDTEYHIQIFTKNEDFYEDEKYQALMDSFNFKFDKTGSTEDLSDVNKEGYRKYQDTRLKWSVDMIPYWEELKDSKIQNKVAFTGKDEEFMSVEVYSLDKGDTLDSVTKKTLELDAADLNPAFYSVTRQEKVKIGGMEVNKVYYTLKHPKKIVYGYQVFFADKNYKYIFTLQIPQEAYNNTKQRSLCEGMLNSIKIKQLDPKVTGKLLDPKKVTLADLTRKVETAGYSMEIPFNWIDSETSDGTSGIYLDKDISASVNIVDNVPNLSDFLSFMNIYFNKDSYKIESMTQITDRDYSCYKFIIKYTDKDGYTSKIEQYVMQKNNKIYILSFIIDDMVYGTKNINIINKIWNSFKFK